MAQLVQVYFTSFKYFCPLGVYAIVVVDYLSGQTILLVDFAQYQR